MPTEPSRQRRRLLRKIGFSILFGLLLLELGLRVFDIYVPMANIWRWHPTLGWTQDPAATFEYEFDGDPVTATFNSLGFRDIEHEWEKPEGTRRIVVLGDSFCEAVQVNFEETFYTRLEVMLDARGEGDWEVINLGVGDWGQAQQLIALRDIGLRFAPDIVICQMFPLNDIGNNGIDMYGLVFSKNDVYRPYFVERDGELVEQSRHPVRQGLRRLSRIFVNLERVYLSYAWSNLADSDDARWQVLWDRAGFSGLQPLLYTFVPDADQPEAVKRSWRTTELLLQRIAEMSRDNDAAFVPVVIAWGNQLSDAWPAFSQRHPPPAMEADYPERRLTALFERMQVPAVMTKEVFEADLDRYHPARGGHLGPGGHELVAEALFATLQQSGLLER